MTDPTPPDVPANTPKTAPPAGWYDDPSGKKRWFDGATWTDHYQDSPAATPQPIQVTVAAPVQTDSRQARDKSQYVRQQKGHSLVLHLLLGVFVLWIPAIYISVSPNHYWHA